MSVMNAVVKVWDGMEGRMSEEEEEEEKDGCLHIVVPFDPDRARLEYLGCI